VSRHDWLFLLGCTIAAAGLWMWSPPACLIAVGLAIAYAAIAGWRGQ